MNNKDPKYISSNVTSCARCGENHNELQFQKFSKNPVCIGEEVHNYWQLCPVTNEPILLRVIENED
tara:strand:+ start:172 stop:369 length:198 start_codon:yes stop_codon:yes gene_type:complete